MILWSGQVVSIVGTRVTAIAYPLLVLALTGSPAKAGIVGFSQTVPNLLFFPVAGAVVDRWDRKRLMLACEAGRALSLASIPVALGLGILGFLQIVLVAFVEGTLYVFFLLAEQAALPRIVAKDQLPAAIAQNQAKVLGAGLLGQPLGGALFSLSRAAPFVADALSYAASFLSLLFVRTPLQETRSREHGRMSTEIAEGILWVWREPFLRVAVFLLAAVNFVLAALTLVLIVRAKELGASPPLIGLMLGFFGVGGIAGALIAPRAQRRLSPSAVIVGATWILAIAVGLYMVIPNVIALGIVLGLSTIPFASVNVVLISYRYALVPDRLLGRTQSAILLVGFATIPLGSLAAGLLLEAFGAISSLAVLAALTLAVASAVTLSPAVRNAPRPDDLAPLPD
jgi:predicted MFS family arabinose efflux permease